MVSTFTEKVNDRAESEWGIVSLGLAVMGTGDFFVEC